MTSHFVVGLDPTTRIVPVSQFSVKIQCKPPWLGSVDLKFAYFRSFDNLIRRKYM